MAATAVTTTPQDITGDFDLAVTGLADVPVKSISLLKALGAGGTDFLTINAITGRGHYFVKNTGTNAFKLSAAIPGVTVKYNQ